MSEYPSVRQALFGNGHVANAWCAVKYVTWHLFYGLMALVFAIAYPFIAVSSRLDLSLPSRVVEALEWTFTVIFAVSIVISALALLVIFYVHPIEFLAVIGGGVLGFGVGYALLVIDNHFGLTNRLSTAREKPVARRIYGHCPVSFSIEPKWFKRLYD